MCRLNLLESQRSSLPLKHIKWVVSTSFHYFHREAAVGSSTSSLEHFASIMQKKNAVASTEFLLIVYRWISQDENRSKQLMFTSYFRFSISIFHPIFQSKLTCSHNISLNWFTPNQKATANKRQQISSWHFFKRLFLRFCFASRLRQSKIPIIFP